jgi:hypothetical protein
MAFVLTLLLVIGGIEQTSRTIRGDGTLPRGQTPSCSALLCNLRGLSQSGNSKHLLKTARCLDTPIFGCLFSFLDGDINVLPCAVSCCKLKMELVFGVAQDICCEHLSSALGRPIGQIGE